MCEFLYLYLAKVVHRAKHIIFLFTLRFFFNARSIAGKGRVIGGNTEQRATFNSAVTQLSPLSRNPWKRYSKSKCWQQIDQKVTQKKTVLFSLCNFYKGRHFKTAFHLIHELRIGLDASFFLDFGSTGLCFLILYSFYDCGAVLAKGHLGLITSDFQYVQKTRRQYIENTSWKVLAYGIYARVVDVSEIERVSAANE